MAEQGRAGAPREPDSTDGGDPRLDFFSPSFDAALALAEPALQPPRPRVRTLETLGQCEALLPPDADVEATGQPRRHQQQQQQQQKDDKQVAEQQERRRYAIERGARAHQRAQAAADAVGASFDAIARDALKGPLRVLGIAAADTRRVKVVTRHKNGVRGSMIGSVVLFDRHCNIAMRDADEEFRVRLPRGRKVVRESPRPSVKFRPITETRTRHMHQVLVRGESVVLVSLLDA